MKVELHSKAASQVNEQRLLKLFLDLAKINGPSTKRNLLLII